MTDSIRLSYEGGREAQKMRVGEGAQREGKRNRERGRGKERERKGGKAPCLIDSFIIIK